ncbi:hypothetical protein GCM10011490_18760 [Pseudoclavibacter endophyticus]|nr:hypothetical protein GCM10011490_18760 [Pseudoclavibacter endophyticus]
MVKPELFDEFVEWFTTRLTPVREAAGFTVAFAAANRERSEFVWAVSVDGDRDRFDAIDAAYAASPERAAAFEGVPQFANDMQLDFVERLK